MGILEPLHSWSLPLHCSLSWGSWSPRVVGPCPSSTASLGDPGAPVWLVRAPPARPLLGILEPQCGWSLPLQCGLSWGSWCPHVVGLCCSSAASGGPPLTCCAHTVPSSVLTPQAPSLQAFALTASFRPHIAGSLSSRSFLMSPL